MPVIDIFAAALSNPAGRVVEGPVRTIVNEVLQDRGYASPAEVQALRDDLAALRDTVTKLSGQVVALESETRSLTDQVAALRDEAAAAPAVAPAAVPAAPAASAAAAERLGLSLADYDTWRAGGLPGVVGPDGYLEIDGQAWRVDASLEGKPFDLTKHKSPRVRVNGEVVSKTKVG